MARTRKRVSLLTKEGALNRVLLRDIPRRYEQNVHLVVPPLLKSRSQSAATRTRATGY